MKSDMRKWVVGFATSIIVGLVMWWLTHNFLARPELRIVDSHVSGCNPAVTEVTVYNSGDKLAENCYIRVGLFIDDGGLFPSSYEDLRKRFKREHTPIVAKSEVTQRGADVGKHGFS